MSTVVTSSSPLPDVTDKLLALAGRITGDPKSPFFCPGVAIVVARGDEIVARIAAGVDAHGAPIRDDSIFPLASASKLVPGLAVLRLADQGALAVDDPIERHLPEAAAAGHGVTLRALLSHTSGLPLEFAPGQVEYGPALDWPAVAAACLETPLAHAPGTQVQYSNIGYGLLGIVIERLTGLDYRTAVERLVIEPLGVEVHVGRSAPRPHAAVLDLDSAHVGTELEPFNSAFSQGLLVPWSAVYAPPASLLALAQTFAGGRPDLVRDETLAEARRDQTGGLPGGFGTTDAFLGFNGSKRIVWPRCAWGLTVELRGDKRPHWTPAAASPDSFGHIGSSGCLAWCDPARGVSWAILGPRTTDSGWMLRYAGAVGTIALSLGADAG